MTTPKQSCSFCFTFFLVNMYEVTWKNGNFWLVSRQKEQCGHSVHGMSSLSCYHQQPGVFCPSSLLIRHMHVCRHTHATEIVPRQCVAAPTQCNQCPGAAIIWLHFTISETESCLLQRHLITSVHFSKQLLVKIMLVTVLYGQIGLV